MNHLCIYHSHRRSRCYQDSGNGVIYDRFAFRNFLSHITVFLLFLPLVFIHRNTIAVDGLATTRQSTVLPTSLTSLTSTSPTTRWQQCNHQLHLNSVLSIPSSIISKRKISTTIGRKDILLTQQSPRSKLHSSYWDGDDIRWKSKVMRRFQRSLSLSKRTICITLVLLNIVSYTYQVISTVNIIRIQHSQYWPSQSVSIIFDSIIGSARPGPYTMKYVHNSILSQQQLYRFLSSGFLHGSIIHLIANMNALISVPNWVENGLGRSLYLTTYLYSIIGGNVMDMIINLTSKQTYCLGASGGICGLYGLMFICFIRMGNRYFVTQIIRNMLLLFFYGIIFTNISNAGHFGGFLSGIIIGLFCGPSYTKDYNMVRKNSLQVELYDKDYRQVMGYDRKPSKYGLIPINIVWIASIIGALAYVFHPNPSFSFVRLIPNSISGWR